MTSRRILIVDDNRDAVAMLASGLRKIGHIVQVAFDGASAVMAAERFRPEIAMLDLGLPDMAGFETCIRIRQSLQGELLAAFAVTGWSSDEVREQSSQAGFDKHFVKPVKIEDLANAIGAIE